MPSLFPVKILRDVFVTMEDGVRLALTVYLPDAPGDGPFPAVVESLPYRKDDDCFTRDHQTYTYLAERGIAGIRVDIRGTGSSQGVIVDEYLRQEQLDNLAVLEWAAGEDWCSGRLGMWGISWGGFSALQTAMLRPPQLHAIVAMHATHDRFACDVHYTGGSLHAAEQLDWPGSMISTNALPPLPHVYGDGWFEEWMRRLEQTPQWPLEWMRHQMRDNYWRHGSPSTDYRAIEVPTLLVGGWLDGYVDGMVELSSVLGCPTRTIVGPWGHFRPATGVPAPTLDHYDLMFRWFAHHLRGDDNRLMEDLAPITYFERAAPPYDVDRVVGVWRQLEAWPGTEGSVEHPLSEMVHGDLDWSGPQWVGSHAPFWDRGGFPSGDSRADDDASMCFETAPMPADLVILGSPRLKLRVATDQEVGLVAARLIAVDPEGTGHLICRGSRNLAFPVDLSDPSPPAPGQPIDVEVVLPPTSATVPAGWRLRLAIAGADFPVVWPPGHGFRLSIDPAASTLTLPSGRGAVADIEEAGPRPGAPAETTRSEHRWDVTKDGAVTTFRHSSASTEIQPDLVYTTDQWWELGILDEDPGSLTAETESTLTLSSDGWSVTTIGGMRIAGATDFTVTIELRALHDGAEVFHRTWTELIPRLWA